MNEKLGIYICNNLVPEVAEVLKTGNYPDVQLMSFPNSCIGSPLDNKLITNLISPSEDEFSKILFFISSCMKGGKSYIFPTKKVELIHLEQCFELILNKEIIYHFIRQGYYLVTNGWLKQYKNHISDWGFEEKSAKVFFNESLKKILFLDTGLSVDYRSKLETLSEYMGLPYEVFPVGLSHCRNFIESEILRWRFENERVNMNQKLSGLTKENADYFFVFQQLQKLVDYTDETTIVNEVFNLLTILFAPQQIGFQKQVAGYESETIWLNSYAGKLLKDRADFMAIEIAHQNEILGIFEIYGIRFPEYIGQYRKVEPIISNICGVSISNARKYSELTQTKLVISKSEKQFHSLFDNMHEGVALHELEFLNGKPFDYRIIDINARFVEILSISREQVVGKLSTIAYARETPPYFNEYLDVTLNKKTIFFETYYASIDKHFTISVIPWHENGFATIFTDITQRRKNEEKLHKLSTAVEQSPVSIVITDTEGNIEYGNETVFSLSGYAPDEVLGKNPRIFKSGNTSKAEYKLLWNTIKNGKEWRGEFLNKKKNGELYWEQASISAVRNEKGKITNYLAVKEDITSRKKAEEALAESEERYKLITQNTLDIVFMLDKAGKQLFFNESVEKILGYQSDELIGKSFTRFVPKSELPKYFIQLKNVFLKKEIYNFITKIYHKNGDLVDVEINGKLVAHAGKLVALGTIRDISARKRNEIIIIQKNEELLKINAEKDKFFSIIAHDLRSPFNGFLGLTQIMAEDLPNLTMTEVQEIAVSMKNSATSLYSLLENLLQWAQIQKGAIPFHPEPVSIGAVLSEMIDIMAEPAKKKGIEISLNIPEDLTIKADKNMIQTVIRNLVSNAVKFTSNGGKINVWAHTASEQQIEIAIQDSGIGMSQSIIDNLFRIYFQTSQKGTEGEDSTGLGLILCKEFIEKHNGKIYVESEVDKGSIFRITLPVSTQSIN